MTKAPRRIFIGSAWPYANGSLHLGHLAALLPADVLARYYRLTGAAVFFGSGSDCHGTPVGVRAEQEHTTPAAVADRYHTELAETFRRFGFSYDLYGRTTTPRHTELVQELFLDLYTKGLLIEREAQLTYCEKDQRFLPDRYVEGTCPVCGDTKARGDQCDSCKSLLDPTQLQNPRCKLCGTIPTQRPSKHLYLQLPKFQKQLEEWTGQATTWRANGVAFTREFLAKGLKERAVTRDLEWGVSVPPEIPGYEHKRIYVWFEAVCGYYTVTRQWAETKGEPDAWRAFWDVAGPVRHYYVHGKDNIPFHTIIWPAILLGRGGLHLPDTIVSSEYLTLEGRKFSTSQNWAVWANDVLERYQPDAIRYYLLANGPETRDADFSWDAFVAKTNNELVATYGNFVQRVLSFARAHFPEGFKGVPDDPTAEPHLQWLRDEYGLIGRKIEKAQFKEAIADIFAFVSDANAWLDQRAPWKTMKTNRNEAASTIASAIEFIVNLADLTAPFLPFQAQTIADAFGFTLSWNWQNRPSVVPALPLLFTKLDPGTAAIERARLGSA